MAWRIVETRLRVAGKEESESNSFQQKDGIGYRPRGSRCSAVCATLGCTELSRQMLEIPSGSLLLVLQ